MPPKRNQRGKPPQSPRQKKHRALRVERQRSSRDHKRWGLARGSTPGTRHETRPHAGETKPLPSGERLQKILASAGIASRRECEELIREGRVEVDRHVVTELGTRVDPERQEIRVDGEALLRPKLVYFAVHKPAGVISTSRDPAGRPRVIDLLPPNTPRAFAVGRLDMSSEGLILVTNDGELANGLTHPRHGVEKIYQVQVAGQVERDVVTKLHRGVHLAEGFAHAKHVKIKSRRRKSTLLEMVLDEGRNREIRRLLAHTGHKVQRLRRIAVGPVRLGELPPGAVRQLTKQEIVALQRSISRVGHEEPSDESEIPDKADRRTKPANQRDHRAHRERKPKKRKVLKNYNSEGTRRVAVFRKAGKKISRKGAKAQR